MPTKTKEPSQSELQRLGETLVKREFGFNMTSFITEALNCGDMGNQEMPSLEDIENFYGLDSEQEPQEILEWWPVSDWMKDKLLEKGEPILNYQDYNYFWGRTCSGQAICLDHVIQTIAKEVLL